MLKRKKHSSGIEQLALPLLPAFITVHCFFVCPYIAQAENPVEAHRLMELHYASQHSRQIEAIVRKYTGRITPV